MKKIVLILLICLIFAGTVIVCFKGFNVGLPYKSNINISVYVGKKIEDKDMQEITKEVFKGKQAIVQKVELFEDMISITTEEMSEEELNEMRQKQEERKKRTGYYGSYAKCRKLSVEEQIEKIKADRKSVV